MIQSAVDNDLLLKIARYQLVLIWLASLREDATECGMLGAARFLVRKKLKKVGNAPALAAFEDALALFGRLEPSNEELMLAANYENAAQKLGVQLDNGESQLCAIVVTRGLKYLFTGDKRAIVALSQLIVDGSVRLENLKGRVVCLEQTVLWILERNEFEHVRLLICSDKTADRAISICFSCSAAFTNEASARDGLTSYVSGLKAECAAEIMH